MKTRRWHVRKVYSKKFTRFPKTTGHTDGKKTRSTSRESQSEMFSYLWRTRRPEGHSEVRCLNPISGLIEPGEPGQATDCPTAWCIRWSLKDTTAEVIGKKKSHIVNNMVSLNCFPKFLITGWIWHFAHLCMPYFSAKTVSTTFCSNEVTLILQSINMPPFYVN